MLATASSSVRYLNKKNNSNERENYSKWWKEQIEQFGTSITYYTNGYSFDTHNFVYGEDPTAKYGKIENVVMLTDITNDSLMLSKFGIAADSDMTAVAHISSFYQQIGCEAGQFEPKAGDLIQLTEYGEDRPGGRVAPIYEITERDDEYLPMTNPLIGHYVWYIKCKRWEYSFEPGVDVGPNNKQLSDGGEYGRYPGGENPQELFQPYPDSVQNSSKCIYDYYTNDYDSLPATLNQYVPQQQNVCNPSLTSIKDIPGPYSNVEYVPVDFLNQLQLATEFITNNSEDIVLRKKD